MSIADESQVRTAEEFERAFPAQRRRRIPPKPTPTPSLAATPAFELSVAEPPPPAAPGTAELIGRKPPSSDSALPPTPTDRFRTLRRDQLMTLPNQPRSDNSVRANLQELVDSIRTLGLQTPLQVAWNETTQLFQVYDGHRRLMAIDELTMTTPQVAQEIPVVVLTAQQVTALQGLGSDDRLFVLSLTINATRSDLPKSDRGKAYRRLIEQFGVNGTAKICGVSRQTIHKTLRAAEDLERHVDRQVAPADRPAWTQKQWFAAAESLIKESPRLDEAQRQLVVSWLQRLAKSVDQLELHVPPFVIDGTAANPANSS